MGVERTKPSTTAVVVVDVQEKLAATMPSARMRDVERALAWLESEHALEREGTRLTPIKGIEPVRR